MAEARAPRAYLPIDGIPAFQRSVQELVFGGNAAAVDAGRVVTVQALGGTGALRTAAEFLHRFGGDADVWISQPSWENHRALFEAAGFTVHDYPYYDPVGHGVDFDAMRTCLAGLDAGSVVLLHVCCHNPTGADLTGDQWDQVIDIVRSRRLLPVLDLAYQGFAQGLEADADPVRRFAERCAPVLVANSFSKSFALYSERVGALSVVTTSTNESDRVRSQLKRVIRANFSSPQTHGAAIVTAVLTDPELRRSWERDLTAMRERVRDMRNKLVDGVEATLAGADFRFVLAQNGMFSYSGLSAEAVARLRETHGIYALDSGRICVAALNDGNVAQVARAVTEALEGADH
jgi:aromatic-amino-acid transaminase